MLKIMDLVCEFGLFPLSQFLLFCYKKVYFVKCILLLLLFVLTCCLRSGVGEGRRGRGQCTGRKGRRRETKAHGNAIHDREDPTKPHQPRYDDEFIFLLNCFVVVVIS